MARSPGVNAATAAENSFSVPTAVSLICSIASPGCSTPSPGEPGNTDCTITPSKFPGKSKRRISAGVTPVTTTPASALCPAAAGG